MINRKEIKMANVSLIQDAKSSIEWCSLIMGEGEREQ